MAAGISDVESEGQGTDRKSREIENGRAFSRNRKHKCLCF